MQPTQLFGRLLILSTAIFSSTKARQLISADSPLIIPLNLLPGEEIVPDIPFLANPDSDEDVSVSLSPSSDSLSLAPSIVAPGVVFKVILNDADQLRHAPAQYKIQALGLISGNVQDVPLDIQFVNDTSTVSGKLFKEESYDLRLTTGLRESEIALIELSSIAPSNLRFSLSGPFSEHFSAHGDGARLVLTSQPCPSCRLPHAFSILVSAHSDPPKHAVVNFISENEGIRFSHEVYKTELEEGASQFTKLVKLRMHDAVEVTYTLNDASGLFSVHPTTGIVNVLHPEFVSRDLLGSKIRLTATATSRDGKTAQAAVHIKLLLKHKNKLFQFTQPIYEFSLAAGERVAGMVEVEGGEKHGVEYRLSEGSLFSVEGGEIRFFGDFPKADQNHSIVVVATSNNSLLSVAVTKVAISQFGLGSNILKLASPQYAQVKIDADAVAGTSISSMDIVDEDVDASIQFATSSVRWRDAGGRQTTKENDVIEIRKHGNRADVLLKKSLSELDVSSFSFSVEGRDAAHPMEPPVNLNLDAFVVRSHAKQIAEIPLSFVELPSSVMVPSNSPVGSFVYRIDAAPSINPNTPTVISAIQPSKHFKLHPNGTITVLSSLSDGLHEMISFSATRSSSADSLNGTLSLDVISRALSHPPQFVHSLINATVSAQAPVGSIVANCSLFGVEDVVYTIAGSDKYEIDQQGSVMTSGSLSMEKHHQILVVTADSPVGKAQTRILVTIDQLSDSDVKFEKEEYKVDVMENIPINSFIVDAQVVSKLPNSEISYKVESEDKKIDLLDIDEMGRVTTKEELYGASGEHWFIVSALVGGEKAASCRVGITIKPAFSCIPQFVAGDNDVFYIDENLDEDAVIGNVSALELDEKCELRFALWDGERRKAVGETGIVRIDEKTGEMRARKTFDYEKTSSYVMVLALMSGQRQFVQQTSILQIRDVDDHPVQFVQPPFAVEVAESSPVGHLVVTVHAIDRDQSQNVYYRIKNKPKQFEIDETSGEIRLAEELDREEEDEWKIDVGASNSDSTSSEDGKIVWTTVTVHVKDVNDNGPIFGKSRYEILASGGELPGKEMLTVNAVDPDTVEAGPQSVLYYIDDTVFEYRGMRRTVSGMFTIGKNTGRVVLAQPISDFVGGIFYIGLRSADSVEETSRKDKAVVKVFVYDKSDVVWAEVDKSAMDIEYDDITNLTESIRLSTGLRALVRDVGYHHVDGFIVNRAARVKMVLLNQTSSEIIPAEKAVAMMERLRGNGQGAVPQIMRDSSPLSLPSSSNSPLLLIAAAFGMATLLVSLIFSLLICSYRSHYLRERKLYEDDVIISSSLARPHLRPLVISPPLEAAGDPLPVSSNYAIQERKMSVGPDDTRRRN